MKFDSDVLKIAQQSINDQINSLKKLHHSLNQDFLNCIDLIISCSGRVITIGVGKSAIIAQKISATLNSTGTLSFFIHASDAHHGDLGAISSEDLVFFISKSGNTQELCLLLSILKDRGNKIVAMSGNKESFLAKNSHIFLDTSIDKEACPNNLAPTSSTTLQLVMGDALAITLVKLKNIKSEDFAKFHPGGTLGKKLLLKVDDIFDRSNVPKVSLNDSLERIIIEISSKRLGATAVLENGRIVGMITDGDLRRMIEKQVNTLDFSAVNLMTENPKIINKSILAFDAIQIMKTNGISQLIIEDNDEYIGMIHIHDILKHNII